MTLLSKISTFAAKIESTIGTAESLTASEGGFLAQVLNHNANIAVQEVQSSGGFNRGPGVAGGLRGFCELEVFLTYDGTTSLPEWATVLLPMCGYVNSSQVFTQRSEAPGSNVKTGTIAGYFNGKKRTLSGCAGNVSFVFPSGEPCRAIFRFEGSWEAETDTAIIADTPTTDHKIVARSGTLSYGGTDYCTQEVTIDSNNVITPLECLSATSGYKNFLVTDAYPSIVANPESTLVATDDRWGNWTANTEAAFSLAVDGPAPVTTTSTVTFAAPKAQIFDAQQGDSAGVLRDTMNLRCNKNVATQDTALSITFAESTA